MTNLVSRLINGSKHNQGVRRHLTIGAGSNFILKIFFKVIGLLSITLLARLLGVEGLGTYVFAFTIVAVLGSLATATFHGLLVQKVAAYQGLQNWSLMRGLIRRALQISFTIGTVLAVFTGLIGWYLIEPDNSQLRLTLLIAVILVPLYSLIHLHSAALQGLGYVIVSQVPLFVARPLFFLALLVIIYFVLQIELSTPVVMIVQILAVLTTLVISILLFASRIPPSCKVAIPANETRNWVRDGFPFFVIGVLHQVTTQADVLILGTIAGTDAVGIYRPAATIALLIMFGSDAINLTIRPTLARRYATNQTQGFQRLSGFVAWAGFGIATLGAGIAMLFGDLMLLVFGPSFTEGATALAILCIGRVIFAAFGLPGAFLDMTGRQSITMWGLVWAAAANIALNLALIPRFGVNGAAIATAASLLVLNIHNMIAVRRELSINTTIFGLRLRGNRAS